MISNHAVSVRIRIIAPILKGNIKKIIIDTDNILNFCKKFLNILIPWCKKHLDYVIPGGLIFLSWSFTHNIDIEMQKPISIWYFIMSMFFGAGGILLLAIYFVRLFNIKIEP